MIREEIIYDINNSKMNIKYIFSSRLISPKYELPISVTELPAKYDILIRAPQLIHHF